MRCQCAVLLGLACARGFGLRPTLHGRPGRTARASTPGEILFEAQREAMAVAAEEEGACFEGRVTALPAPSLAAKPKSKAKAKRRRGAGFAGATDAAGDAAAAAAAAAAAPSQPTAATPAAAAGGIDPKFQLKPVAFGLKVTEASSL